MLVWGPILNYGQTEVKSGNAAHPYNNKNKYYFLIESTLSDKVIKIQDKLVLSGNEKVMVLIAHERGEDTGMDNCARCIRTFVSKVPVEFISFGVLFWRKI